MVVAIGALLLVVRDTDRAVDRSPRVGVWYVASTAAGTRDGTSWRDAFTDLHDALGAARQGDEIWIAEGRYTPDRGTRDRFAHFCLPDGVQLYGGFAGHETQRDQRDPHLHPTILSGDLAGDDRMDDDGESCAEFTNCCRFHNEPGCDDPTCEAMVCAAYPKCCRRTDGGISWGVDCHEAARDMCCHLGHWQVCENSFGLVDASNTGPSTVLDGLTLYGTHGSPSDGYGSGAAVRGALTGPSMNLVARHCTFKTHNGPCIASPSNASPTLEDCVFDSPSGVSSYFGFPANPTFRSCAFDPHGLYLDDSATIENCFFRRCRNPAVWVRGSGGTLSVIDSDFLQNQSYAVWTRATALTVRRCNFVGNRLAGIKMDSGQALVTETMIVGNAQAGVSSSGSLSMRNCLVAHNRTPIGSAAGISFGTGTVTLDGCAVVGNVAEATEYSGLRFSGTATVRNSVFWSNSGFGEVDERAQISPRSGATLLVQYSDVQGWTGAMGGFQVLATDPLFVDADGADDVPGTLDDDLRLLPGSPAINAGDPTGAFLPLTDLDVHPRVLCGRVDLGPYEFGIGDANCDRVVNLLDVSVLPTCVHGPLDMPLTPGCESFDYNADGAVDLLDLALMQSAW